MSRRSPFGTLLLILLLAPTPALCTICAVPGCEQPAAAADCPMKKAPAGEEGMEAAHGAHGAAMAAPGPMGRDTATETCCGQRSRPATAAARDCCAGREAEVPAATAPAFFASTVVPPSSDLAAPDLAAGAGLLRQAMPPPAAQRALYTLHGALLI